MNAFQASLSWREKARSNTKFRAITRNLPPLIYIVLLAPCASALRTMLSICNNFAVSHGLHFNVSKIQLICFRSPSTRPCSATNNTQLHYSDQVTHLGHILTSDLNDKQDTIRVIKDMNRKANSILCIYIQFC